MSRLQKAVYAFTGFVMIIFGLLMYLTEGTGYLIILLVLEFALMIFGLQQLIYYFTMARYMVGGIYIFYKGVLLLDAGLFALNMDDVPRQYAMIYLIITMGFSGLLAVVHSIESKRLQSGRWIHQFFYGSVEIISAIVCLSFLNSQEILTTVYAISMFHAGGNRILSAFRKSSIVYIE